MREIKQNMLHDSQHLITENTLLNPPKGPKPDEGVVELKKIDDISIVAVRIKSSRLDELRNFVLDKDKESVLKIHAFEGIGMTETAK